MIGHWIAFSVIFLLIPFGVVSMKRWVIENNTLTEKQIKTANCKSFLLILYYWLIDLFYMSCFISSILWQFIFGGAIMLIIFMDLAQSFSYPNNKTSLNKWVMLQNFLIGIGLSIYLIYIIPNDDVRTITIPIVAAVYGGFITLIGVAWTIKKSDFDRKEDEIKKARPLVFVFDPRTINTSMGKPIYKYLFSEKNGGTLKKAGINNFSYCIRAIYLNNSDYSHAALWGFRINDDIHIYDIGQVIPKNAFVEMNSDYKFTYNSEIKYVALLLKDMLDNIYELEVNFEIQGSDKDKTIQILSGIETKKTDLVFNYKEVE